MAKNDYDFSFISRRYNLAESSLENVAESFEKTFNLKIKEIEENEDGYIFVGDFGILVGEMLFDKTKGAYKRPVYHSGSREAILKERNRRINAQRTRKFKLQRRKRLGIAIAAAGIIALTGLGVIKSTVFSGDINPTPVAVQEASQQSSIYESNDILLLEWANHAMGEVSEVCDASEYDGVQSLREQVYTDYFAKGMSSYYNYVDICDQEKEGFPAELIAESKENAHSSFREKLIYFNDYLKNSIYFSDFTFENSPFTDAVLVDQDGNVLQENDNGSVILSDSEEAVYIDSDYRVYVRAEDANFTLTNLPEDAIVKDGIVYVDSSHLSDTEKQLSK